MEKEKNTRKILSKFKKTSQKLINKNLYTELFYINNNRRAIEFLSQNDSLIIEKLFKTFLPHEFMDFVQLKILNDDEEEIKTWFYEEENLVIVFLINWGFKKQEISIEINIENFQITSIDEEEIQFQEIEYNLLNNYLISLIEMQAKNLSMVFNRINKK